MVGHSGKLSTIRAGRLSISARLIGGRDGYACRTQGRRDGRGFYLYGRGRRAQKRVDDTVYMALKITPDREPMVEEIQFRCVLVLVNEALRDLRYVVRSSEILRRRRSLEHRFGARFESRRPCSSRWRARAGGFTAERATSRNDDVTSHEWRI